MATKDGYDFIPNFASNSITIKPNRRNRAGAFVKSFGLGNAVMSFRMGNLPTDGIIVPITDESTGQGLLPTSPFKLKRWFSLPENMTMVPLNLTGYLGWSFTIDIPMADGGSVKQVQPTTIIQNGYGCEKIVGDAPRLNW